MTRSHHGSRAVAPVAASFVLLLSGCTSHDSSDPASSNSVVLEAPPSAVSSSPGAGGPSDEPGPTGVVTLGFAGDVHFQLNAASLLGHPRGALGPITAALRQPDLMMVNLESAITSRGTPQPKDYVYRTDPRALDLLAGAGVDVITMANNHAADYGLEGFRDTLRDVARSPVPVVGVGRDRADAFHPYRVTIGDTDLAVIGADASPRETPSRIWAAGPTSPGTAAARTPRSAALLGAVRTASRRDDVVVVYLHWGRAGQSCPTPRQREMARAVAGAGADVIVGAHAHILLGAGWLGDTYVSYGLGNFVWYHDHEPETGVLGLRIEDGSVVADSFVPGQIRTWGPARPLHGAQRADAVAAWRALRGCTGLASRPPT
jgi:poly-gamma-glutamate synthesis protein (capsule biosynthesis protein)